MSPTEKANISGKPIVIKIGSRSIIQTNQDGTRDVKQSVVRAACKSASQLFSMGYRPVIVSSGAVAAGMGVMGLKVRPKPRDEQSLSSLAGIGQPHLFSFYLTELRNNYNITAAQVLPDWTTFADEERRKHLLLVLEDYFAQGIIPIVNGNDATSFADLKFGDNDMMAALIGILIGASHLVLTTDVDGFLLEENGNKTLVEDIDELTPEIFGGIRGKSIEGTGGMRSKLLAADLVRHAGIFSYITNVKNLDRIDKVLDHEIPCTSLRLRPKIQIDLDDACRIVDGQSDGKFLSTEEFIAEIDE